MCASKTHPLSQNPFPGYQFDLYTNDSPPKLTETTVGDEGDASGDEEPKEARKRLPEASGLGFYAALR